MDAGGESRTLFAMHALRWSIVVTAIAIVTIPVAAFSSSPVSKRAAVKNAQATVRAKMQSSRAPVIPAMKSSAKAVTPASGHALPYTMPITDDWQKKWKLVSIEGMKESLPNVEVIHEQGQFPAFFRIHFPKGSVSRTVWKLYDKPIGGVAAWMNPEITAQSDLYFRYFVRFPNNFDFWKGGGLPGIFSGIQNGRDEGSAGSAYFTWNERGAVHIAGGFSKKLSNAEWMDTVGQFAADGQWHRLDLHLRLNTHVSKANGAIEAWLDRQSIATASDIIFHNKTNDLFDAMGFFATLAGIDVLSGVPKDMSLDLAGFVISDRPVP